MVRLHRGIAPNGQATSSRDAGLSEHPICGFLISKITVLEEWVYQQLVRDVELRRRLTDSWSSIQQMVIDQAINQWRFKLRDFLLVITELFSLGAFVLSQYTRLTDGRTESRQQYRAYASQSHGKNLLRVKSRWWTAPKFSIVKSL